MGTALLHPMRAGLAGQGDQLNPIAQAPGRLHRQNRHGAGSVIGHNDKFTLSAERQVHAVHAAGIGLVEDCDPAGRRIHGKRGGITLIAVYG